jgi:hypothetical protein
LLLLTAEEKGKVRYFAMESVLYYGALTKFLNGAIDLQNKLLDKDTWGMI